MMVSIILPAHNEEEVLGQNVRNLEKLLSEHMDDFEIIISEDGSTDNTLRIAKSLEGKRTRVIHNPLRLGKGAAIANAAGYAKGEIIIFMDADLASDPKHVKDLVEVIENGADIVIGSRYLKKSKSKRRWIRYIASITFNWLVRIILGSGLSDHQCGFKAFRKELVLPVINEVKDKGWFWDTEFLVRAQRKKLKISEIPIEWKEEPNSKFNMLMDSTKMGMSILRFRFRD